MRKEEKGRCVSLPFLTAVYGWIKQDDDGNYVPQETITVDEGSTVNLAIGYQKGGPFTTFPRDFHITTSGSAGMEGVMTKFNGSDLTLPVLLSPIIYREW